jgi:TDG/mug DNA glycosylase family protein
VPLRDIWSPQARVLFVGINPSLRSEAAGHHFASPGNPFWRLLHASKLTPVALTPEEDGRLTEFGLGLTNLCARATRQAAELAPKELAQGQRLLERKIRLWRPAVVALVGVTLYRFLVGDKVGTGPGEKSHTLGGAPLFVLPNPSGLNASFPGFRDKQVWFDRLRRSLGTTR